MTELGSLRHSRRCYHWLFVWLLINGLLIWAISSRGFVPSGTLTMVASSTILFGYGFLIDMSTKAWWNAQQVWWQHLDYLSITPMRHSVRFDELTEVVSADHPANLARGKPFDRFLLISPADTVTILPSFHRRVELEELLSLIYEKRPEVFTDGRVTNFINGDYGDWWR